jgi:hypothetical protein
MLVRGKSFIAAVLFCGVCVWSMPAKQQADTEKASENAEQPNFELESELDKLKHDGIALSNSQRIVSKNVNGKVESQKIQQETISDAKTGEVVAKVEKTVTKDENGEHKDAHVVVPSAGVNEQLHGSDADKFELAPAEDVAKYIFDTSDVDSIQNSIGALVDGKKLTKKAADDYMDLVANRLNDMHEVALKEMVAEMEKQKKVEDQALQDMVEMAQVLSKSEKTEQTLYNYIKKLYTLYKSEGDEYARDVLKKYTASIKQGAEAGTINEAVQDSIFAIILQALHDVNQELGISQPGTNSDVKAPSKQNPQDNSKSS